MAADSGTRSPVLSAVTMMTIARATAIQTTAEITAVTPISMRAATETAAVAI